MSKAAVVGLSKGLARDLAPRGITDNTVEPAQRTPTWFRPLIRQPGQMFLNQVPLGRYAETEEITTLVEYIASPDAAFITGSQLDINGTYDLMGNPHTTDSYISFPVEVQVGGAAVFVVPVRQFEHF